MTAVCSNDINLINFLIRNKANLNKQVLTDNFVRFICEHHIYNIRKRGTIVGIIKNGLHFILPFIEKKYK